MSTEDDLFKAYMILSLDPGTDWQVALTRYKTCVMVWHPDRVPDDPTWQEKATEELKKLNWARDILEQHFESGSHSSSGYCACRQRQKTESERPQGNAGPDRNNRSSSEPPDFSAFTNAQSQSKTGHSDQSTSSESSMQEALREQRLLKDQSLRWKVATALGIAYVSLCLFGITANSAKETWSEWAKSWQKREVPKVSEPTPNPTTNQPKAYVPAYNQFPGGNASSWQNQQSEDRRRREEAAQKKREQDLYFAKLEVDKYETAITYNRNEITQIDIKLSDPQIAETTRRQLLNIRDFRVRSLHEAEMFLRAAQEKVAALDPSYVPARSAAPYSPFPCTSNTKSGSSLPFISAPPSSSLRDRLKDRKLFP